MFLELRAGLPWPGSQRLRVQDEVGEVGRSLTPQDLFYFKLHSHFILRTFLVLKGGNRFRQVK